MSSSGMNLLKTGARILQFINAVSATPRTNPIMHIRKNTTVSNRKIKTGSRFNNVTALAASGFTSGRSIAFFIVCPTVFSKYALSGYA
mgnify:CR=1 FL=1